MATLVLSTVGTILGGPVGGAIGSLLGQSIDQQLFGPGPRHGPRLGDLNAQTSSYGSPIPRLFGTMRVAGSIVWSTDLQESSEMQGAKGQPDAVTYSYSASFAVALSSRPVADLGRIWADGKLIRTAAGEFTVSTGFRFYDGSDDQPLDPLIGSIEGVDPTPAYRGSALAVFEHLQLAEFGNRIPFLTFEVIADAEAVPVDKLIAEASNGDVQISSPAAVEGYAAYGPTIASAIEPLVEILGIALVDDGESLVSPLPSLVEPLDEELGCSGSSEARARSERSQVPERNLPWALSLGYYDATREYQSGLARASLDDAQSVSESVNLPAVLDAGRAKALAETVLARRWAERDKLVVHLPAAYLMLRPGCLVRPGSDEQIWRAERVTVDSLAAVVELRPVYSAIGSVPADPGRALPSAGVAPAPTEVAVVELPDDGTGESHAPVVAVAVAAGSATAGQTWRPVALQLELGGISGSISSAAAPAVMGMAAMQLGDGQSAVLDLLNSVEVELTDSEHWLESCDDDSLAGGANLASIGSELIQFGQAIALAPGRFRLSRLLRGRRGTEWAMNSHQPGERFVMLDGSRLRPLQLTSAHSGARIKVRALGLADEDAPGEEMVLAGEAMRPPSPVHLRATLDRDGTLRCTWVRRSRRGWVWLDGVDSPLGCSAERYRVTLRGDGRSLERETDLPQASFSSEELEALGPTVEVVVVQVGDLGVSRAASISVSIS